MGDEAGERRQGEQHEDQQAGVEAHRSDSDALAHDELPHGPPQGGILIDLRADLVEAGLLDLVTTKLLGDGNVRLLAQEWCRRRRRRLQRLGERSADLEHFEQGLGIVADLLRTELGSVGQGAVGVGRRQRARARHCRRDGGQKNRQAGIQHHLHPRHDSMTPSALCRQRDDSSFPRKLYRITT